MRVMKKIVKSDVRTYIALPFRINAIFAKISGGRRPLCMMKFVCGMSVWNVLISSK